LNTSHRPRCRLAVAAFTAALALFVVAPAHATTVLEVDVADMTELSEWVVNARVASLRVVDGRSEGEGVHTAVTLTVIESYKGDEVPSEIVVRLPGGATPDGLAVTVPGTPRLSIGEEVVLFLERTGRGLIPCGLGQGVWRVHRGDNQEAWVTQSHHGLHLVTRAADGSLRPTHPPRMTPMKALHELVVEVYEAQLAPRAPGLITP